MKMKWDIIYHIQIEMLDLFNKIQTEWTQTFNKNRQKSQNTKGPKTMCDLQCLGRWISFFHSMQEKYQQSKHFIPILSKYIFKFELNYEETNKII
jgi:hypothetical protein